MRFRILKCHGHSQLYGNGGTGCAIRSFARLRCRFRKVPEPRSSLREVRDRWIFTSREKIVNARSRNGPKLDTKDCRSNQPGQRACNREQSSAADANTSGNRIARGCRGTRAASRPQAWQRGHFEVRHWTSTSHANRTPPKL